MPVSPIPKGFSSLTPCLMVDDGARAIDWYQHVFGAEETFRMNGPNGRVIHAQVRIGNSMLMIVEERPGGQVKAPRSAGITTAGVTLYVPNVDDVFQRAVSNGAAVTTQLADMFWGDRTGNILDPFGHLWSIATHKEELTPEQIQERARSLFSRGAGGD